MPRPEAAIQGRAAALYRASVGSTIAGGTAEVQQLVIARRGLGLAMTLPLEGVRVVEVAQYVAGPLAGSLLAELGAEVIKVEPPGGDAYRQRDAGCGRDSGATSSRSTVASARSCSISSPPPAALRWRGSSAPPTSSSTTRRRRARRRSGSAGSALHAAHPALVVGVVTSFGPHGPLAGLPAYDLVAQGRSGLLTSHASRGDRVPVRAGGIPMADLTAGHLLASGVLAALVRSRTVGEGQLVEVSLLGAALAVQIQDLVWLEGEADGAAAAATRADLEARADEIAGGLAMNPYYRCYEAADGFLAVACLNLAQRRGLAGAVRARRSDDRGARPRSRRSGGARRRSSG